MSEPLIFFIFFIVVAIIYFIVVFFVFREKKNQTAKILDMLKGENLLKMDVVFSQNSNGMLSKYQGLEEDAILHFNQKMLLLTSKKISWFNPLKNDLPIIFVMKFDNQHYENFAKCYLVQNIFFKNGECNIINKDFMYKTSYFISVKKDYYSFLDAIRAFKN